MNRWVKVLLVTGISFLLCLIFFSLLSNFNIDNKMHENLNMLALVLSICLSLVIVNTISQKREKNIKDNSLLSDYCFFDSCSCAGRRAGAAA